MSPNFVFSPAAEAFLKKLQIAISPKAFCQSILYFTCRRIFFSVFTGFLRTPRKKELQDAISSDVYRIHISPAAEYFLEETTSGNVPWRLIFGGVNLTPPCLRRYFSFMLIFPSSRQKEAE